MKDVRQSRVFVGIKTAGEIAAELAGLVAPLAGFSVRLVPAVDIHLTLVPPWNETDIPQAVEKLRHTVDGFESFVLTFERVRYGPNSARPRLVWAECAIAPPIVGLKKLLAEAFAVVDERPFQPHATLARLRGNGRLIARRNPLDLTLSLTQRVRTVELFQSPPPGDIGYKVLASIPFRDPMSSQSCPPPT